MVYIVLLIWAVLAILFAHTDLQISIAVVDPSANWALFLAEHGQKPGKLVFIVALFLLAVAKHEKVWKSDLLAYLFIGLSAFVITAVLKIPELYRPVSIGLITILQVALYRLRPVTSEKLLLFAKVTVAMSVVGLIFVNLGKDVWGRVRFVQLDGLYSQFTPWYLPQGYNDYKSFPSGHAAFAWMLLPVLILVADRRRVARIIVASLTIAWALSVVVSRVWLGAHYASDVLFSSGVVIVSFLLFYSYVKRHGLKSPALSAETKVGEDHPSRP